MFLFMMIVLLMILLMLLKVIENMLVVYIVIIKLIWFLWKKLICWRNSLIRLLLVVTWSLILMGYLIRYGRCWILLEFIRRSRIRLLILVILLCLPMIEMGVRSSQSVNKFTEICPNSLTSLKSGIFYIYCRGKSCKFVPQKVGLSHVL